MRIDIQKDLVVTAFQALIPEQIQHILPIPDSFSRACWKIDTGGQRYVLKLSVRKQDEASFRNELHAYELLEKSGMSVPRVLAYACPPNILGGFYYVQEWVEGEAAATAIHDMDPTEKKCLAYEFGRATAQLHEIKGTSFSEDMLENRSFSSWSALCDTRLQRLISANEHIGILSSSVLHEMKARIQAMLLETAASVQPSFTHRDLYLSNILVRDNQFQTIIDFEAAKLYDPYWDFVKPEMWVFREFPKLRAPFYAGYESISPLSVDFQKRYLVCAGLEYLAGIPYFTSVQNNPDMVRLLLKLIKDWKAV